RPRPAPPRGARRRPGRRGRGREEGRFGASEEWARGACEEGRWSAAQPKPAAGEGPARRGRRRGKVRLGRTRGLPPIPSAQGGGRRTAPRLSPELPLHLPPFISNGPCPGPQCPALVP